MDLTTDLAAEVLGLRDAAETAHPTQTLDSTTLFLAEVKRVRDLTPAAANEDTNTVVEAAEDGIR